MATKKQLVSKSFVCAEEKELAQKLKIATETVHAQDQIIGDLRRGTDSLYGENQELRGHNDEMKRYIQDKERESQDLRRDVASLENKIERHKKERAALLLTIVRLSESVDSVDGIELTL